MSVLTLKKSNLKRETFGKNMSAMMHVAGIVPNLT